jgi:putative peptidoglycan lipid II flippase
MPFAATPDLRGRFLVRDFPLHRLGMALLRSVATVGSYTLVSRVFGFIRDILTAAILGAGPVADAFFVAQRLPNLFRSLFAEGAFNAAFVPLASGALAEGGKPAVKAFAEEAFSVLFAVLLAFVLLGEMFMPWLMTVIAPGFSAEPGKFDLVVALTRITFPYLLFISLTALQGGLLNAVDRFAAPAATPILLNLFLIAGLLLMTHFHWQDGEVLAWALSAAGLAQFLWLMVSCAHAGVGLRLRLPRLTPRVKQTLRIMGPGVLGAGVTQLNLVISTALASLLPGGSVSYLYYADRLNQLPLGVVGIAVATAILPPLSRQVRTGDLAGAAATQNRGVELALLLTLPATAAFVVLAQPIMTVLFQRGAFGPVEAEATAAALAAYAIGLPAFVLVKVLAPGFFAHHDAGQGGDRRDGDKPRSDLGADAILGACRDRARSVGSGLAAGDHAAGAAGAARPLPARPALAQQIAAHRRGGARHGRHRAGAAPDPRPGARRTFGAAPRRAGGTGSRRLRCVRCVGARLWRDRLARIARPADAVAREIPEPTGLTRAGPGR